MTEEMAKVRKLLELKLLEGLRGPSADLDADEWDLIEREARERLERERSRR